MNFYKLDDMNLFLGGNCNSDCIYCYEKDRSDKPSTDELMKEIERVKAIQTESITITGGEPTIHPGFFELLQKCLNIFDEVTLLSNLLVFIDFSKFDKLFGLENLNKLHIIAPFDSHIESVHDEIVGVDGSYKNRIVIFNKICKNRGLLKNFTIGILVNKLNLGEIQNTVHFINGQWNGTPLFFKMPSYNGFSVEDAKKISISSHESFKMLKPVFDSLISQGKEFSIIHQPYCFLVGYERHSLEYGVVKSIYESGNIEENLKIYKDEQPDYRRQGVCHNCIHSEYCYGISKTYWEAVDDAFIMAVVGEPLFTMEDYINDSDGE